MQPDKKFKYLELAKIVLFVYSDYINTQVIPLTVVNRRITELLEPANIFLLATYFRHYDVNEIKCTDNSKHLARAIQSRKNKISDSSQVPPSTTITRSTDPTSVVPRSDTAAASLQLAVADKSSAVKNPEIRPTTSSSSMRTISKQPKIPSHCTKFITIAPKQINGSNQSARPNVGPSTSPGPIAAVASNFTNIMNPSAASQAASGDQSTNYQIHSNRQDAPASSSANAKKFRIDLTARDETNLPDFMQGIKRTVDKLICVICGLYSADREVDFNRLQCSSM